MGATMDYPKAVIAKAQNGNTDLGLQRFLRLETHPA